MWVNGCTSRSTRDGPSPTLQKAMLTPSVVLAYWMRGSMTALSYSTATSFAPGPNGCQLRLAQHLVRLQVLDGGQCALEDRGEQLHAALVRQVDRSHGDDGVDDEEHHRTAVLQPAAVELVPAHAPLHERV